MTSGLETERAPGPTRGPPKKLELTHGACSIDDGSDGGQRHLVAMKTRVRAEIGRHRSCNQTIWTVDQRTAHRQQH